MYTYIYVLNCMCVYIYARIQFSNEICLGVQQQKESAVQVEAGFPTETSPAERRTHQANVER